MCPEANADSSGGTGKIFLVFEDEDSYSRRNKRNPQKLFGNNVEGSTRNKELLSAPEFYSVLHIAAQLLQD